jgi:hypothetical protein
MDISGFISLFTTDAHLVVLHNEKAALNTRVVHYASVLP